MPPRVIIDNDSSNRFTVIEVNGLDRIGLLYDLTEALYHLNLNIASAHITTFGERAIDVFYVTDLTGAKIVSATRHGADRAPTFGRPCQAEKRREPDSLVRIPAAK